MPALDQKRHVRIQRIAVNKSVNGEMRWGAKLKARRRYVTSLVLVEED